MSRAGDDAESPVAGGVGEVGVAGAVFDGGDVERAELTSSLAIVFPVSSALFNAFAALFMKPTVSAIVDAEIRPARSWSSIASVNRVNVLALGEARSANFDSRNST